jgi:hypothetical protein
MNGARTAQDATLGRAEFIGSYSRRGVLGVVP